MGLMHWGLPSWALSALGSSGLWSRSWFNSVRFKRDPSKMDSLAGTMKRPLIREDLNVIQYQSHETDNIFITSDGTSPYNFTR